jgi:hypothetical protein
VQEEPPDGARVRDHRDHVSATLTPGSHQQTASGAKANFNLVTVTLAVHPFKGMTLRVVREERDRRSGRRFVVVETPTAGDLRLPEEWTDRVPQTAPPVRAGHEARLSARGLLQIARASETILARRLESSASKSTLDGQAERARRTPAGGMVHPVDDDAAAASTARSRSATSPDCGEWNRPGCITSSPSRARHSARRWSRRWPGTTRVRPRASRLSAGSSSSCWLEQALLWPLTRPPQIDSNFGGHGTRMGARTTRNPLYPPIKPFVGRRAARQ